MLNPYKNDYKKRSILSLLFTQKHKDFLIMIFCLFSVPALADDCPDINALINFDFPAKIKNLEKYRKQQIIPTKQININCDTDKFLKQLFHKVTIDAKDDMDRVKKWITFLQKRFYHSCFAPIDEYGQAIYHPIWLLKNRGVHCGQAARVAVDGLIMNGIQSRVVQINGHVLAEALINGKYRLIDPDVLNVGEFIADNSGELVSVQDIFNKVDLVSSVVGYGKMQMYPKCNYRIDKDYTHYFSPVTYGDWTTPYIFSKTSSAEQRKSYYYGWNVYLTESYS
jgi:hypothetical protein